MPYRNSLPARDPRRKQPRPQRSLSSESGPSSFFAQNTSQAATQDYGPKYELDYQLSPHLLDNYGAEMMDWNQREVEEVKSVHTASTNLVNVETPTEFSGTMGGFQMVNSYSSSSNQTSARESNPEAYSPPGHASDGWVHGSEFAVDISAMELDWENPPGDQDWSKASQQEAILSDMCDPSSKSNP
jgi:hypothetical protein